MTSLAQTKAKLRKRYQQLRNDFYQCRGEEASSFIASTVTHLPEFKRADVVMAYVPFRAEVDTWRLMGIAQALGKRLVLPRTVPSTKELLLCEVVEVHSELEEGSYGIPEPVLDRVRQVPVVELDLVFVPGLVFDSSGFRVGYGGGYYDRLLGRADRSQTAFYGLAFELQFHASVPRGEHDQGLDGIVTEERVVVIDN
jgi:5-formyltetrahydrofolate cyclo-ligase